MHWVAQELEAPNRVLVLRGYVDPADAAARNQFQGQVVVAIGLDGIASLHGLLNASGAPLTREDRAQIERILRESGAVKVVAVRHGKTVTRTK